jgi:hypothetical protein
MPSRVAADGLGADSPQYDDASFIHSRHKTPLSINPGHARAWRASPTVFVGYTPGLAWQVLWFL